MQGYIKKPHLCPVCEKYMFSDWGSFEICEICGWEDDPQQAEYPDEDRCANELSLNDYREKFKKGWRPDWIL